MRDYQSSLPLRGRAPARVYRVAQQQKLAYLAIINEALDAGISTFTSGLQSRSPEAQALATGLRVSRFPMPGAPLILLRSDAASSARSVQQLAHG